MISEVFLSIKARQAFSIPAMSVMADQGGGQAGCHWTVCVWCNVVCCSVEIENKKGYNKSHMLLKFAGVTERLTLHDSITIVDIA